jgi:membrane associated rhomboid family serine protease
MRTTLSLIIANILVFILQILLYPFVDEVFSLVPGPALGGYYWQFISYMFLHSVVHPEHIMLNMFLLFIFGVTIERALGWKRYLILYFISGIGSALLYISVVGVIEVSMIGASGAVFGVMAAYGFMFPRDVIWVYKVPVPVILPIILLAAGELLLGIVNLQPEIANIGHFGGIVTGMALMFLWKRRMKPRSLKELRDYQFFWS